MCFLLRHLVHPFTVKGEFEVCLVMLQTSIGLRREQREEATYKRSRLYQSINLK